MKRREFGLDRHRSCSICETDRSRLYDRWMKVHWVLSPSRTVRKGEFWRMDEYIEAARGFQSPWGWTPVPETKNDGPKTVVFFKGGDTSPTSADLYKAAPEVGGR